MIIRKSRRRRRRKLSSYVSCFTTNVSKLIPWCCQIRSWRGQYVPVIADIVLKHRTYFIWQKFFITSRRPCGRSAGWSTWISQTSLEVAVDIGEKEQGPCFRLFIYLCCLPPVGSSNCLTRRCGRKWWRVYFEVLHTKRLWDLRTAEEKSGCVISGLLRGVVEIFAFLVVFFADVSGQWSVS